MKFPCDRCDYKATRKEGLLIHIKYKHEDIRFPCSQCNYQANQKKSLHRHTKSVHEDVRFPCVQCDFKATMKGELTQLFFSIDFLAFHSKRLQIRLKRMQVDNFRPLC